MLSLSSMRELPGFQIKEPHRRHRTSSAGHPHLPPAAAFQRDASARRGRGEGFKLAMRTLDIFRTSVAAAALGFGQRALDEALQHSLRRPMLGKTLADLQLTQAALADMATATRCGAPVDLSGGVAARSRRPGHPASRDGQNGGHRGRHNARSTERQLFAGRGVVHGSIARAPVSRHSRTRASTRARPEVQKLIIARQLLDAARAGGAQINE